MHILWPRACTGWDGTVCALAQDLSKQLGVAHTACVEALLQQVSLIQKRVSFVFDPNTDTPPNTFATMVVLLLPPGTVCYASQSSAFFSSRSAMAR